MTVYLVGAGPGDPGLLTRRGAELLGRAEVVLFDRLVDPRLLDLAPAGALRIDVGKRPGQRAHQDDIHALLLEHAQRASTVVRLKGGDPFVFGRGGEEAEVLLRAGVTFEVVPGVTSAFAAPASAGVPVTHRGLSSSVTVVSGHLGARSWSSWAWRRAARSRAGSSTPDGAPTRPCWSSSAAPPPPRPACAPAWRGWPTWTSGPRPRSSSARSPPSTCAARTEVP
jgi:uroporphyrin-III C-methyltransferase